MPVPGSYSSNSFESTREGCNQTLRESPRVPVAISICPGLPNRGIDTLRDLIKQFECGMLALSGHETDEANQLRSVGKLF